jgi:phosphatidate phosphatase APP1
MKGMPIRRTVHRAANALDRRLDRRRGGATRGRVIISPYRGFGRGRELFIRGRVLVEKELTRAAGPEPLWRSVANTYRRFATDEVGGARVRATYRDAIVESVSDAEGFFQIRLEPRELASHALWHEVGLALPDHGTTAVASALIPSAAAQFAVISDIDDTVLVTNATSLVGMARSVIRNAASRLPFEGVAELYGALHRQTNPLFYVSSSPWNLYELLNEFMDLNGIPPGPMLLQDWGIDEDTLLIDSHERHKLAQINRILDYYPELQFVLIGDSGQHDPEIYLRVVQAHPGRIRAAFIRDVTPDLRDQAVARILEQSNAAGVEMLYVPNSAAALEHARRIGLL